MERTAKLKRREAERMKTDRFGQMAQRAKENTATGWIGLEKYLEFWQTCFLTLTEAKRREA